MKINTPDGKVILSADSPLLGQLNPTLPMIDWWFAPSPGRQVRPVTLAGDLILLGSDGDYIYALNRHTGMEVFRYKKPILERPPRQIAMVVDKGELYTLSLNGVYAFKLKCSQIKGVNVEQ